MKISVELGELHANPATHSKHLDPNPEHWHYSFLAHSQAPFPSTNPSPALSPIGQVCPLTSKRMGLRLRYALPLVL